MLEQYFNVTSCGHETVGTEWDATFVEPFFYLIRCGLENAGASNDNLKLAVDSAEPGQYSFSHFADQLYREAARFAGSTRASGGPAGCASRSSSRRTAATGSSA